MGIVVTREYVFNYIDFTERVKTELRATGGEITVKSLAEASRNTKRNAYFLTASYEIEAGTRNIMLKNLIGYASGDARELEKVEHEYHRLVKYLKDEIADDAINWDVKKFR